MRTMTVASKALMSATMVEDPDPNHSAAFWKQVLARDTAAEGHFVYAVRTTGIYCRASCPSRRPKRENVEFFLTAMAARSAGYRACQRCFPDVPVRNADLVSRACVMLDIAENELRVAELAEELAISKAKLMRTFKDVLGVSLKQYATARRMERFREELKLRSKADVTDVMYATGFGSSSRLYEKSRATLGMTPTQFRSGATGEQIGYAVTGSPLGRMLVAATEKGICAIAFGDTDAKLVAELKQRFNKAELVLDEERLEAAVRAVVQHLQEPRSAFALPLDLRATAFQQRVWHALQKIPTGETRSYSAVAKALGRPTAVRAVAQACARNPVAVVVPCHRVVASDAKLAGYRWGVERKRKLLEREARD